jgi:single-strand DNA-binding protein
MRSVNKVIIVGNLTRDPEMKQTPNGQSITTFGIATNREWVTQEGDRKQSAEFHECVAWAKLAEICEKYLKKSKLVYVEGYLKTRSWDTEEGVRKFKTEIVVEDMIMLNKREDSDGEYASKSEDKPAAEEKPAEEETPAETPAEDKPAEEPATEAPAEEEAPAETPAETEAPAEETSDDSDENPIDKDLGL